MNMKVTRRQLLRGLAYAGTAAAGVLASQQVGVAVRGITPERKEQGTLPQTEKMTASVCLQCPGGCGIVVRTVNGRAVKIGGNPLYPVNKGGLCIRGQAALQSLYDPDRIRGPLKRAAKRGAGEWQPIGWEEAIETVSGKLKEIRDQGKPHSLVVMGGHYRGQMHKLIRRFLDAFGSPNDIGHSSIHDDGIVKGNLLTQGVQSPMAYDWDNVNYLLSFSGSFLEEGEPHLRLQRAYGNMRTPGSRVKMVQFSPRFSATAAKADEWIPLNVGTDGAVALGIAHVIIKNELYDKKFLAERSLGFYDWTDEQGNEHIGFKTLVLSDYDPETVSYISGVLPEEIERVAMEFAANRPALSISGKASTMQTNGIYNQMAIHSLNALVGNIERPGGVLVNRRPPLNELPEVPKDSTAQKGLSAPRIDLAGSESFPFASNVSQILPENLLSGRPYPAEVLFLYYTNPLYSRPDTARFYEAFEKIPFIVSFSPFMDESTERSDIILPDHTFLERWQDDVMDACDGIPIFGVRQPVVKPLYDTMNTGDVIIELARKVGGAVADAFPWPTFQDVLKYAAEGLHKAHKGSIIANSFSEFWGDLLENGGWWDAHREYGNWQEALTTPSGKFEFYSQTMEKRLEQIATKKAKEEGIELERAMAQVLSELHIKARGDEAFLPHYEPPRFAGDESEYPFCLHPYRTPSVAEGMGANQPWLLESFASQVDKAWSSWVEINPDTAAQMGVSEGDEVWIESQIGRIRSTVKLFAGAMPNVVNAPWGLGHKAYGRWAEKTGVNPNEIIVNEYDRLAGVAAWYSTRVKIYKA